MLDDQKELFIWVDTEDNVLGTKPRFDCHHDRTLTHRAIDIILTNENNEILLQKRSMKKDTYPGFYSVSVSGHVSPGESYEEAAIREMQEEIGVAVPLTFLTKYRFEDDRETEIVSLFTGTSNGPFHPNSDEVTEVGFYTREEIGKMSDIITPGAKLALQEFGEL